MRSTRKQPFCWQEKKINRLLRKKYKGSFRVKILLLYATITEIDSDFNNKDIKYYTKTIATYSGLDRDYIPKALKILEDLNIIEISENRKNGKFGGKILKFTPDKIKEIPLKTVAGKTVNGKTGTGKRHTLEDSTHKEDISLKEDMATGVANQQVSVKDKTIKFITDLKNELKGTSFKKDEIEELKEFVAYWTEPNKSRTKLKWELEKTWDMQRRVRRWFKNKKDWGKTNNKQKNKYMITEEDL